MAHIDASDLDQVDLVSYLQNLPPCEHLDATTVSYPAEWGTPPGEQWSVTRSRWVHERVAERMAQDARAEEERSREEHAEGGRFGPFPKSWGLPRGERDSAERAAWVKQNVEKRMVAMPLRELRRRVIRMQNEERLAYLRLREQQDPRQL